MSAEITVPTLGESIVEATVSRWMKKVGEAVTSGEALVELETDKVNAEVSAVDDGVLKQILKSEGETVNVGDILAILDTDAQVAGTPVDGEQATPPEPLAAPTSAESKEVGEVEDERASPVAKRMAAEHGIELNLIHGSGPGGRIKKEDVEAYLLRQNSGPPPAVAAPTQPTVEPRLAAGPVDLDGRGEERVRMSRRRQTIARRLVEAQHTAAMLTTFNEVNMTGIMDLRSRHKKSFKERHGVSLGYMSFFTKASIGALKVFPRLNAEIQGDEFVLKKYYDIGVAVGTEEGLVVPVVRDADRLSFAEIERRIADLAKRAREKTLTLPDLQGGTFTISNGGIYGSLLSTPILNPPQVGILGMHKIEDRPMALNGQVVIRPMMYLALSYDHRIVDGTEAVRFLVHIKDLLEDPAAMLLED